MHMHDILQFAIFGDDMFLENQGKGTNSSMLNIKREPTLEPSPVEQQVKLQQMSKLTNESLQSIRSLQNLQYESLKSRTKLLTLQSSGDKSIIEQILEKRNGSEKNLASQGPLSKSKIKLATGIDIVDNPIEEVNSRSGRKGSLCSPNAKFAEPKTPTLSKQAKLEGEEETKKMDEDSSLGKLDQKAQESANLQDQSFKDQNASNSKDSKRVHNKKTKPFSSKRIFQEIFDFYKKLQSNTKKPVDFEEIKERMNYMNLGEFLKFCSDFSLIPADCENGQINSSIGRGSEVSAKQMGRSALTSLFNMEATGHLGIHFRSFLVGII